MRYHTVAVGAIAACLSLSPLSSAGASTQDAPPPPFAQAGAPLSISPQMEDMPASDNGTARPMLSGSTASVIVMPDPAGMEQPPSSFLPPPTWTGSTVSSQEESDMTPLPLDPVAGSSVSAADGIPATPDMPPPDQAPRGMTPISPPDAPMPDSPMSEASAPVALPPAIARVSPLDTAPAPPAMPVEPVSGQAIAPPGQAAMGDVTAERRMVGASAAPMTLAAGDPAQCQQGAGLLSSTHKCLKKMRKAYDDLLADAEARSLRTARSGADWKAGRRQGQVIANDAMNFEATRMKECARRDAASANAAPINSDSDAFVTCEISMTQARIAMLQSP